MLKEIPKGLVKIDLVIMPHSKEHERILEYEVLKMLVRDYRFYYSKEPVTSQNEPALFEFYCQPAYKEGFAYRLGVYMQTMLEFHKKEDILNADHVVYDGFPDCIRIDL